MTQGWIYTVDPLAEEPIMLINNHIGFDPEDGMGIDGAQFMSELLSLDGMNKKRIQVWINSVGGSVMEGYNIYSAILKSKTKVDTYCIGMAASIAAVIFQAGRTRYMSDYGFLMYHNPSGSDDGKIIGMMKDSLAKMTARSGKDEADIIKIMNKETYINASEASQYGFCDEVEPSSEQNKKRMSAIPVSALYKEAKAVFNSIFEPTTKKVKAMLKVTAKLNLNPEATEDSILSEITKIENRAKAAEVKNEDWDAKFKALENKKAELEEEMNKVKKEKEDAESAKAKAETEVTNMKKEKDDAVDKAATEECKNIVNKYVKIGKIKNDAESISFWTAIVKADKVLGEKQLEALPLNKQGVKIEIEASEANADLLTSVCARAMADVRNKLEILN